MKFDLILHSMTYESGQLAGVTPGFFATSAGKRAARGRQDDLLLMLLSIKRGKTFNRETIHEWQERLSADFFKTSGSVTTAMRTVIDEINVFLLEQNLKLFEDRDRQVAHLSLGVIHHDTLFIAQCGSSHAFLVNDVGLQHFFDADVGVRGLGVSRTPNVRYYQSGLKQGDYVLLSPLPPQSWDAGTLVHSGKPNLEQLWRRLHHQMPADQIAGLIQVVQGDGKIRYLPEQKKAETKEEPKKSAFATEPGIKQSPSTPVDQLKDPLAKAMDQAEQSTDEVKVQDLPLFQPIQEEMASSIPSEPLVEESKLVNLEADDFNPVSDLSQQSEGAIDQVNIEGEGALESLVESPKAEISPDQEKPKIDLIKELESSKQDVYKGLAKFLTGFRKSNEKIKHFFSLLGQKLFPSWAANPEKLSTGTMLAIAIIVPILVVAFAFSIYMARGKEHQYLYYLAQAQAAANNAVLMEDTLDQRETWNQVLFWTNQAGSYKESQEVTALESQALAALDQLDGAVRLIYKQAIIGEQVASLDIQKIIPLGTDLYLLDSYAGSVLHLTQTNRGYQVDPSFVCQSSVYDGIKVSKLVDVVSVPINNPHKAPILAVDESGTLLYCAPGKQPLARSLTPPETGWQGVRAMMYDSGMLYLLDPASNALWVYSGSGVEFSEEPESYFSEYPMDLSQAIDFAANGEELFILFSDGHVADCLASGLSFSALKCSDPAQFNDERVGVDKLNIQDLKFGQLSYSPPPDPSLFFLAPEAAEIYQFSLRLNLNRVYRANTSNDALPERRATAFALSSSRTAFIAFGNQLFYAVVP